MAERLLIVGSGGREHALGWKLTQSKRVPKLFFAPGNAGTALIGENIETEADDIERLVQQASDKKIRLTIVGPELPLSKGITDAFDGAELPIFGPPPLAARLETSKIWAVDFMRRHGIPHPEGIVTNDPNRINGYVAQKGIKKVVVKKDGLAAGKGVCVPDNEGELEEFLTNRIAPRERILIQEYLTGFEASVLAFCDGNTAVPIIPIHDYKRLVEDGPMTGGMGAYASYPSERMSPQLLAQIQNEILQPTVDGMREEGHPYIGILYAGLMITKDGPKVLEYNARFGDPETQPLMMILETDLLRIIESCIFGGLKSMKIKYKNGHAVCVVLASKGYPDEPETGHIIKGLNGVKNLKGVEVFHAGTVRLGKGNVATSGGRVIGITAFGSTVDNAAKKAYSVIGKDGIYFDGMQYRKDIGQ